MDDSQIEAYFVEHLSDGDNPNDLILEICTRTGKPWGEIQPLLEHVREEHQADITRRQSPLLVILALVIFAGGVGLTIYSAASLISIWQAYRAAPIPAVSIMDALQGLAATAYMSLSGMLLGTCMAIGSLLGMREVWAAVLRL